MTWGKLPAPLFLAPPLSGGQCPLSLVSCSIFQDEIAHPETNTGHC